MTRYSIVCKSCQRRWTVPVAESVYLELDFSSRPCPHCEAYTLRLSTADTPLRVPRTRHLFPGAAGDTLIARRRVR